MGIDWGGVCNGYNGGVQLNDDVLDLLEQKIEDIKFGNNEDGNDDGG